MNPQQKYLSNGRNKMRHNLLIRIRGVVPEIYRSTGHYAKGGQFIVRRFVQVPYVILEHHFESLFRDGMTWENYGHYWHIDHIKPCSKFNLNRLDECLACFRWSNLQPLLGSENWSKRNFWH
jgi:hypothetical protein